MCLLLSVRLAHAAARRDGPERASVVRATQRWPADERHWLGLFALAKQAALAAVGIADPARQACLKRPVILAARYPARDVGNEAPAAVVLGGDAEPERRTVAQL